MHRKLMSLTATVVALSGLSLALMIPSASAKKPADTTTCPANEYYASGACQYYSSTPGVAPNGLPSSPQTVSGGANPAGVTLKTSYPNNSTLVNVGLPAGTLARKYYIFTTHGVSFGANHSYELIKRDVLVYAGTKPVKYSITALSRPHGRVHIYLSQPLAASTFEVNKNVFEFTPAERRIIDKFDIKKTLVTVQITSTTGKVYTVQFRALFGAVVVIKFH